MKELYSKMLKHNITLKIEVIDEEVALFTFASSKPGYKLHSTAFTWDRLSLYPEWIFKRLHEILDDLIREVMKDE